MKTMPSSTPDSPTKAGVMQKSASSWWWYVSPQAWLRNIVSQEDTPHSIALGTAIGTFIAFTPTVGIQMIVVLLLAWLCKPLFRFNKIAALLAVYISNPVTTLPIYWFNYWIGTCFIEGDLTREHLAELLRYEGFVAWWKSLWELTIEIGWPLLLGSAIVGAICALIAYPLVKWLATTIDHRKQAH